MRYIDFFWKMVAEQAGRSELSSKDTPWKLRGSQPNERTSRFCSRPCRQNCHHTITKLTLRDTSCRTSSESWDNACSFMLFYFAIFYGFEKCWYSQGASKQHLRRHWCKQSLQSVPQHWTVSICITVGISCFKIMKAKLRYFCDKLVKSSLSRLNTTISLTCSFK